MLLAPPAWAIGGMWGMYIWGVQQRGVLGGGLMGTDNWYECGIVILLFEE